MIGGRGGSETPLKTWVKEKFLASELNNTLNDIYTHLREKATTSGDTFTGTLIFNSASTLKLYNSANIVGYTDNGTTKAYEIAPSGITLYTSGTVENFKIYKNGAQYRAASEEDGVVNLEMLLSAGVLTFRGSGGSDLGATEDNPPAYVNVPTTGSVGKWVSAVANIVVSDASITAAPTFSCGLWGTTTAVAYGTSALPHPIFIGAMEHPVTAGRLLLVVARRPADNVMPTSAFCGCLSAAPASSAITGVIALAAGVATSALAGKPFRIIGVVNAFKAAADTVNWTFAPVTTGVGVGETYIKQSLAQKWTYPAGHNDNFAGKWFYTTAASSALTVTASYANYYLQRDNMCRFVGALIGRTANGSSAVTIRLGIPYPAAINYYYGNLDLYLAVARKLGYLLGGTALAIPYQYTGAAVNENSFTSAADFLYWDIDLPI